MRLFEGGESGEVGICQRPPPPAFPPALPFGQMVTNGLPAAGAGNIESTGAQDIYTFTATPGQTVFFDAQSDNNCSPRFNWRCTDSKGAVIFDQALAASGPCGATDPGAAALLPTAEAVATEQSDDERRRHRRQSIAVFAPG